MFAKSFMNVEYRCYFPLLQWLESNLVHKPWALIILKKEVNIFSPLFRKPMWVFVHSILRDVAFLIWISPALVFFEALI